MDQRDVLRLFCDMGAVEREVPLPTEFTVTTPADEVDVRPGNGICETASKACSLRAAIQEANRVPEQQAITVPAGPYDLSIPPGNESGVDPDDARGDLDLLDDVIIEGINSATVIVDGKDLSRIFEVVPGVTAIIRRMIIRNGTDAGGGGVEVISGSLTLDTVTVAENVGSGIYVFGSNSVLDIRDSIIRNNIRKGDGGGISSDDHSAQIIINRTRIIDNVADVGGGLEAPGGVHVIESTIAGNRARIGGGISVGAGLTLQESTVSGNTAAQHGGGVFASGSIVNSTVSGNSARTQGGGVSTSGTLSLLHVTIAANTAMAGGNGLHRFGSGSELSLQNTILANPGPGGKECAGLPPASRGNNIASDTSCGLTAGGDQQATNADIDPLADNDGPTETHLPTDTSPAIDAAADVGLLKDQRGVPRPQGPRPDIGSVERMN